MSRAVEECLCIAEALATPPLYWRQLPLDDLAGAIYARHVNAMTAEKLHAKHEVAEQLAVRDKLIADLAAHVRAMLAAREVKPFSAPE